MKKLLSIMLVLTMALTLLAGCGGSGSSSAPAASSGPASGSASAPAGAEGDHAGQTLKVAAIETAYGSDDVERRSCAAFEAANPGATVELTTDKKLEDVIDPQYEGGQFLRRQCIWRRAARRLCPRRSLKENGNSGQSPTCWT